MAELIKEFEPEIDSFVLVPSDGGKFEVTANDRLLYSKLETHRHVEPGEVAGLLRTYLLEAA
jgi:selT/selW/selH-like putative selenoprotein